MQSHATVVAASSTVSDRPQRMPEGHSWPVDRTAERADNVDAVLTPCPRPERSEPLYLGWGAVVLDLYWDASCHMGQRHCPHNNLVGSATQYRNVSFFRIEFAPTIISRGAPMIDR